MARINRYEEDDSLSLEDKVLGSDKEGFFGTKNYTLGAILDLFRNALPNIDPPITRTSELINDGDDNTSVYVEHDEIGLVALSNSYNDLDDKPVIPNITNTSDLVNDGDDNTSTYVEHDELGLAATSNSYNDLDDKPSTPKEFSIKGTRLEDNVSGTSNIDINVASDFHLTLTTNTVFTFTNLPTGTDVVRCKLRLTGEFTPTFSQGWLLPFGDDYDGTKWNDVIVEISNGNATFEKGELIFQQRENA